MVDNFPRIKELLTFDSEDDFYYLQLIQRRKEVDVRGRSNKNRVIRTYYIKSVDHLEKIEQEIKGLSNWFQARAGINLNKRSFEEIAFHLLKEVSEQMFFKNYSNLRNSYNSVCGRHGKKGEKKWIVDVDDPSRKNEVLEVVRQCRPEGDKVITILPTSSGLHIITTPFDVKEFKNHCQEDIHKNNPTALYYP